MQVEKWSTDHSRDIAPTRADELRPFKHTRERLLETAKGGIDLDAPGVAAASARVLSSGLLAKKRKTTHARFLDDF